MYIRGYIPTPVYIREEEEEECLCMFLGAREIYTYLRFELTVEVWVGREGRWGSRRRGRRGKRSSWKGWNSIFLAVSLAVSLSLCYDMLYSRLLYNVIHYTLSSLIHPISPLFPSPSPSPPSPSPPHLFPLLPILPNHIRRLLGNSIQRTTQMRTQLNRHHTRIHDSHILRPIDL